MKEKRSARKWIWLSIAAVLLTGILDFSKGDIARASQIEAETASGDNIKRETDSGQPELAQLQIPQKMEIVIDPWEMDGKEQIYSKEYIVQNTGETPGILILDFSCKVREDTGLSFWEDQKELRNSEEKRIYMKVLIGTGEEVVFTAEGARYQAELQPGEKLSLRFTGEVNENADDPWKDGDLEIEGMYSWMGEGVAAQSDEAEEDASEDEKETASEDIPPVETAGDVIGVTTLPEDGSEQGATDEEQVRPSEGEQDSAIDNSLSGNGLEE